MYKARPYNEGECCAFGGDKWEVPLKARGEVTSFHTSRDGRANSVQVLFTPKDKPKRHWTVHISEIEPVRKTLKELNDVPSKSKAL